MSGTVGIQREMPIPSLTRTGVVVHVTGVALNTAITIWGAIWLAANWGAIAPPWYLVIAAVLVGLFLADFFSGLLHWGFDTWFSEEMRWMERVVMVVREHHVYPQNIFRYKFQYEAGAVSWVSLGHTLPVIGSTTLLLDSKGTFGLLAVLVSVMVSVLTLFMLQFHKLGHRRSDSRTVQALQRAKLLMSVRHHSQHHRGAHDTRYCLINGWADFVCDSIGFWRAAERAIERLTGAVPRSNDDEWMIRYGRKRPDPKVPDSVLENEKKSCEVGL
ncbi:MAG: fatty acid desaturase family protein [Proteobacteria bacterium]|nr:fatty acid desaturase family protein [Pseudomonadota bacterium]